MRREQRKGVSVMEIMSEIEIVIATVTPKELKKRPIMPPMKATGTKTASVVAAPASTAKATSLVPSSAARKALLPDSLWRVIFSMTTVVASTTIPTASESPIIDILLIVIPIQ